MMREKFGFFEKIFNLLCFKALWMHFFGRTRGDLGFRVCGALKTDTIAPEFDREDG